MSNVFGFRARQPINWFDRRASRSNQYCLYCGSFVGMGSIIESDKEHMVGRNFVPKGSLGGESFNFIFRSCRECNRRKASAEGHLSSITLFNSPARRIDEQVDAIARHKGSHDYHPVKKGSLVQDAIDKHFIELEGGSFQMRVNLTSPPQPRLDDLLLLAGCHVQALFAIIATQDPRTRQSTRILPTDHCFYFGHYGSQDWGNPHLLEIAKRVADWPCYVNVETANGYFRAILKSAPDEVDGWFWALEWNKSLRVIGSIGQVGATFELFQNLPHLKWMVSPDGKKRMRREIPLVRDADTLFTASVVGEDFKLAEPSGTPSRHGPSNDSVI